MSSRLYIVFSRYSRRPLDGKQTQFFKFLSAISKDYSQIEVLGLARRSEDLAPTRPITPANVSIDEMLFPGSYDVQSILCLLVRCGFRYGGAGKIAKWVKDRDSSDAIFFFEGFPLAPLVSSVALGKAIWGEVDSYSRRAHRLSCLSGRSMISRLKVATALYLESVGLRDASAVHVYSYADAEFIRRLHKRRNIFSVPMIYDPVKVEIARRSDEHGLRVLIWADASYGYLEKSVRSILDVIGSESWAKEISFSFLVGNNKCLFNEIVGLGFAAYSRVDDLDQFLRSYGVALIPDLAGTGIKNRALYAMSLGLCVVGTRCAWEGIPIRPGDEGVLLKSHRELKTVLIELKRSERQQAIGERGRRFLKAYFSEDSVRASWLHLFRVAGSRTNQ